MAHISTQAGSGTAASATTASLSGIVQADDILIMSAGCDSSGATITWPSGFTELESDGLTVDNQTVGLAIKRASGSETTLTVTFSGGGATVARVSVWRGRDTGFTLSAVTRSVNVVNSSAITSPAADNVDATAVTAAEHDDLDVSYILDSTGNNTLTGTPPSGFTERLEQDTNGTGGFAEQYVASRDDVTAGSTGTVTATITISAATAAYVAYLVAIPAAAGAAKAPPPGMHKPHRVYQRRRAA